MGLDQKDVMDPLGWTARFSWTPHLCIAAICLLFISASYYSYRRRRQSLHKAKLHRMMKSRKFNFCPLGKSTAVSSQGAWARGGRITIEDLLTSTGTSGGAPTQKPAAKTKTFFLFSYFQNGRKVNNLASEMT